MWLRDATSGDGDAVVTKPIAVRTRNPGRSHVDQRLSHVSRTCRIGWLQALGFGRDMHKMILDHYQHTKNMPVSYSTKAVGLF